MRKSLTIKTLLRSPVKTLLTFLLIVAASFALFSRVTDYAVTSRETANAESFYHGVAALDNTVPDMEMDWFDEEGYVHGVALETEDKPRPEDGQIAEFASLSGVTLEDTRYMTAGLVDDCKRIYDESFTGIVYFLLEGTYTGFDDRAFGGWMFDDVTLLASSYDFPIGESVALSYSSMDEELMDGTKIHIPRSFGSSQRGAGFLSVELI